MNVGQMRIEIAKVYPGMRWQKKVKDMRDDRVIAVYRRLQKEGKIK